MAIKTISQFEAAVPTDNDYILFEQNGEGKHTTIGDAVNTCSLSYEEIMASTDPSTDLTNKVASASALQQIGGRIITGKGSFQTSETGLITTKVSYGVTLPNKPIAILMTWRDAKTVLNNFTGLVAYSITNTDFEANTKKLTTDGQSWFFYWVAIY